MQIIRKIGSKMDCRVQNQFTTEKKMINSVFSKKFIFSTEFPDALNSQHKNYMRLGFEHEEINVNSRNWHNFWNNDRIDVISKTVFCNIIWRCLTYSEPLESKNTKSMLKLGRSIAPSYLGGSARAKAWSGMLLLCSRRC